MDGNHFNDIDYELEWDETFHSLAFSALVCNRLS